MTGLSGPVVVETFAGPGGGSTGLRMAGWTGDAVGVEWDAQAAATARAAGHDRVVADVAQVDPLDVAAGRPVVGFIGTPPCPTLCPSGRRSGRAELDRICAVMVAHLTGAAVPSPRFADPRTALSAEPARWIAALQPRWVLLEQAAAALPVWQHLAMYLRGRGYRTWCGVVDSETFGVPSTRDRAILLADLDAPVGAPATSHQRYAAGQDTQTEPDLFGTPLPAPVSAAEVCGWDPRDLVGFPRRADTDHVVTIGGIDYRARDLRVAACPSQVVTEKARSWRRWPAAGGDPVRVAVDEAALLQSFPRGYPWHGSMSAQFHQIADAVPPLLAAACIRPRLTVARPALDEWAVAS